MRVVLQYILQVIVQTRSNATDQQRSSSATMVDFQTALEAMTVQENDNMDVLWHGPVRFERTTGKTNPNAIDLPKFMHELCSSLSQFDPHFQFRDKNGNVLSIDALPSTQALCESLFNYHVVEKRNVNQMLFVADMISSKPIGQLKNAAFSILKKYGMWMFRHELSISRLDVNSAGWMLGVNSRYHSPDFQRNLLQQGMDTWWASLAPDIKSSWERKLSRHQRGQSIFPDFYCNPRNVRGTYNGVSSITSAFHIITAAADTKIVNEILTNVFPPNVTPVNGFGMYIPMELRRHNAGHFLQLVQRHQDYVDNYQIVSVAGLSKATMASHMTITAATGETTQMTVQAAFQLDSSIHRVDPGSYLLRLGKWNISSTKTEADEAKKWVDTVLASMPPELRHNSEYASFPTAARMKATSQPTTSGYAALAGTFSMDTLKAHQDARDKTRAPPTYTAPFLHNPQDPAASMAIFSPAGTNGTPSASYASAASYPFTPPGDPAAGRAHLTGQTRTHSYGGVSISDPLTSVPSSITTDIADLKTSLAKLLKQPPANDKPKNPVTPDIMQMFQHLSESMQESKAQTTKFHSFMESRVQTMESNINEMHAEHTKAQVFSKTFQDDVHQELRALRAENNELHFRIDNLSQKPNPSPRRKKSKDKHKPVPPTISTTEPVSPARSEITVTFTQPPGSPDSQAPTVSFLNPHEDNPNDATAVDRDADSDDDVMFMDHTSLTGFPEDTLLNQANAMQTDPAQPAASS